MKVVIISGYFNPLHGGHLDMIEAAKKMGDRLVVVVNNDKQQLLKKGKIILDEDNRVRLIRALRDVDEAFLSIDEDPTQIETLKQLAHNYHGEELIFANGGDRHGEREIPETAVCKENNIALVFGVGTDVRGLVKPDSSTRINQELGLQD